MPAAPAARFGHVAVLANVTLETGQVAAYCTSHLAHRTSHLAPHTSHPTPHTSHLTPHTSHLPLRSRAMLRLSATSSSSLLASKDDGADVGRGGKRSRAGRKGRGSGGGGGGGGEDGGGVGEGDGEDVTPVAMGRAGAVGSGSKAEALMAQSVTMQV